MNPVDHTSMPETFEDRLLHALIKVDQQRTDVTPPPTRVRWRRPTVVAATAAALVAVAGSVAAAGVLLGQPTLQAGADTVAVGEVVTVKGSGCTPNTTVTVTLDHHIDLGPVTTDSDGHFATQPAIPTGTANGSHTITAVCPDGTSDGLRQQITLSVVEHHEPLTATFAVAGAAAPGGQAVVKGAGCRPGTGVVFQLDGHVALGSATARDDGQYDGQLPVPPGTAIGAHRVDATCMTATGRQLRLSADLAVVAPEPEVTASKPSD